MERITGVARRLPARRWKARRRESWSLGRSFANWRYSFETWLVRKLAHLLELEPGYLSEARKAAAEGRS